MKYFFAFVISYAVVSILYFFKVDIFLVGWIGCVSFMCVLDYFDKNKNEKC